MAGGAYGGGLFSGSNKDSEGSLSSFLSSDPGPEALPGGSGHGRAQSSKLPLATWHPKGSRDPASTRQGTTKGMVDWSQFSQQAGVEPKKPKNHTTKLVIDPRVLEEEGAQFIDWGAVGEVDVASPQDREGVQQGHHSGNSLTFSQDSSSMSMDVLMLPDGPHLGGKGGHEQHSTASTTVDWNAVGPAVSGRTSSSMQARGKSARHHAGPTCCSFLSACQASNADQEGDAEHPPNESGVRADHDEVIHLNAAGRHISGGI